MERDRRNDAEKARPADVEQRPAGRPAGTEEHVMESDDLDDDDGDDDDDDDDGDDQDEDSDDENDDEGGGAGEPVQGAAGTAKPQPLVNLGHYEELYG